MELVIAISALAGLVGLVWTIAKSVDRIETKQEKTNELLRDIRMRVEARSYPHNDTETSRE